MALYRLVLLSLLVPAVLAAALLRLARGRETADDLRQRLGLGGAPVARGPVVWLHAASVGEMNAARPLAQALLDRDPRLTLVATANTLTGRARAAAWGPRVTARLAPLDTRWALAAFLGAWQPAALVTIEGELWPNRIAACAARRMPVMAAGARLSGRSFALWRRLPGLARAVTGGLSHLAPLDAASRQRFLDLGLSPRRLGPQLGLKAAALPDPADPATLAAFAAALPYDRTILAASTHPGEEEVVLDAFQSARAQDPALRLILAPRHPERGDALARLVAQRGLPAPRRSLAQAPDGPVYLADTLGEMTLWLRLASVTVLGGSLVDKGGHNPFEPVAQGSALVHGPSTANAAEAYAALHAANAAVEVAGAADLALALRALTGDPAARAAQADRARAALAPLSPAAPLDAFVARLGALTGNPALEG